MNDGNWQAFIPYTATFVELLEWDERGLAFLCPSLHIRTIRMKEGDGKVNERQLLDPSSQGLPKLTDASERRAESREWEGQRNPDRVPSLYFQLIWVFSSMSTVVFPRLRRHRPRPGRHRRGLPKNARCVRSMRGEWCASQEA